MRYDLTNVGEAVRIARLDDCPTGLVRAPLLANAVDVLSAPGLLPFETSTSPAEATAFYDKQLAALGWKPSDDGSTPRVPRMLEYTRGSETMTLVVSAHDGVTRVLIALPQPCRGC